jgi:(S)-2-hydroxyglutarate dehydrogenase
VHIVTFRSDHELVPSREQLVRNMTYPVPDPAFPFLGVHLTRGIDGRVHAGPNAVFAAREGYSRSQVQGRDITALVHSRAFRKLVGRCWRVGAAELYRSLSRRAVARDLRRLLPEIRPADLVRAQSGVRAQALDPNGALVDDFVIHESPGAVHVLNGPILRRDRLTRDRA